MRAEDIMHGVVMATIVVLSSSALHALASDLETRDLEDLIGLFAGEFNNDRQYQEEMAANNTSDLSRVRQINVPVYVRALWPTEEGEASRQVFVEFYQGDDLTYPRRLQIINFKLKDGVITNQYYGPTPEGNMPPMWLNWRTSRTVFHDITMDSLRIQPNPQCSGLMWSKLGPSFFTGSSTDRECKETISDELTYVVSKVNVTDDVITLYEKFVSEETGEIVLGGGTPIMMDRIANISTPPLPAWGDTSSACSPTLHRFVYGVVMATTMLLLFPWRIE